MNLFPLFRAQDEVCFLKLCVRGSISYAGTPGYIRKTK